MSDKKESNICSSLKILSISDPEIALNLSLASLESTQLCLDNAMFMYNEAMKLNERYTSIISQIYMLCDRFMKEEKITIEVAVILHIIGEWNK